MVESPLFNFADQDLSTADLAAALRRLSIKSGDSLFVHSDISKFGRLATSNRAGLLAGIITAMSDCVVPDGTLIMPTFTYSFCRNEIFDLAQSPSTVGVLTEFFRGCSGTARSCHPIFSVAASGARQDFFCRVSMDAFGPGSVFEKMHQVNAKLVFLGARFHSCTYLHYVEQCFGVPYRFQKKFSGQIRTAAGDEMIECTYLVRPLDQDVFLDTQKLENALAVAGVMTRTGFGAGDIMTVSAVDLFNVATALLKEDIYSLLKTPPHAK